MSRGHGRVQQTILRMLKRHETGIGVGVLAMGVVGKNRKLTASDRSSINRALRGLQREGLIHEVERRGSRKIWALSKRTRQQKEQFRQDLRPAQTKEQSKRAKLARILGMLGSTHSGERAAAAQKAEEERKRLGLTWEEIIG
jgi:hypothetical protein